MPTDDAPADPAIMAAIQIPLPAEDSGAVIRGDRIYTRSGIFTLVNAGGVLGSQHTPYTDAQGAPLDMVDGMSLTVYGWRNWPMLGWDGTVPVVYMEQHELVLQFHAETGAATGKTWLRSDDSSMRELALVGDRLIVASAHAVDCFDTNDTNDPGESLWSYEPTSPADPSVEATLKHVVVSQIRDRVYVIQDDGLDSSVVAISLNGEDEAAPGQVVEWRTFPYSDLRDALLSESILGGDLLVRDFNASAGRPYRLDPMTLDTLSAGVVTGNGFNPGGMSIHDSPNGASLVMSGSGTFGLDRLVAVDWDDLQSPRTWSLGGYGANPWSGAVVWGDYAYVGTIDGVFHIANLTSPGEVTSIPIGGSIEANPSVGAGGVWLKTVDHGLIGFFPASAGLRPLPSLAVATDRTTIAPKGDSTIVTASLVDEFDQPVIREGTNVVFTLSPIVNNGTTLTVVQGTMDASGVATAVVTSDKRTGEFWVTASAGAYGTQSLCITVGTVTDPDPPPTGETGTVTGTITVDGKPARKQAVQLLLGGAEAAATTTNPQGKYTFENVPVGGGYWVMLEGEEPRPMIDEVTAGGTVIFDVTY